MIQFTNYIGTAPGSTTMEVPGLGGLGVCPPGYYGEQIMLPGAMSMSQPQAGTQIVAVDPYGTESKLEGLNCGQPVNSLTGLGSGVRWDLVALLFGLGFASVLGYAFVKRSKPLRGLRGESKTVRVYFAETAKTRNVQVTPEVWRKLRELKKTGDTYYATTRNDYVALRPYVRDDD